MSWGWCFQADLRANLRADCRADYRVDCRSEAGPETTIEAESRHLEFLAECHVDYDF